MISNLRLAELLKVMKGRVQSVARLARVIAKGGEHPTERTVRGWLKKSEDELRRLHQDSIEDIISAAPNLGIEPLEHADGPALWDVEASYRDNLEAGPQVPPRLSRPFHNHSVQFLGHTLNSPFGASASVLTSDAARIGFLLETGADVITYKTVRSSVYRGHPKPNIYYIAESTPALDPDSEGVPKVAVCDAVNGIRPLNGMMNRFGMPAPPPEVWQADFRAAKKSMKAGQLLILSVVGSAKPDDPQKVLLNDFVRVVEQAVDAGAEVIELNSSCPNCSGLEGNLYHNLPLVVKICKRVNQVAGTAKVLLKIGYLKRAKLQKLVLETVPYVHGYSTINTVSVRGLRDGQHKPEVAFGQPAGISGSPILRCGLRCVQDLANIVAQEGLKSVGIIGIGGAMSPLDVKSYLDSGADVVQATTAFFVDSYFGIKVRTRLDSQWVTGELTAEQEEEITRLNWVRALQELKRELGGGKDRIVATDQAGLSVLNEYERGQKPGPGVLARRHSVPTVKDFKDRIQHRLAAR